MAGSTRLVVHFNLSKCATTTIVLLKIFAENQPSDTYTWPPILCKMLQLRPLLLAVKFSTVANADNQSSTKSCNMIFVTKAMMQPQRGPKRCLLNVRPRQFVDQQRPLLGDPSQSGGRPHLCSARLTAPAGQQAQLCNQ